MNSSTFADLILQNGRITTLDAARPEASSVAIKDGRILAVDDLARVERGPDTKVIENVCNNVESM